MASSPAAERPDPVPVVDAHAHVWLDQAWRPDRVWDDLARFWRDRGGDGVGRDEVVSRMVDPGAERLVAEMDGAGVHTSVIVNTDLGIASGEAPVGWHDAWLELAEVSRRHGGRIVAAPGIDPRRADAAERLRWAVANCDARAVKLWPPAGFRASDDCCLPVYEAASELGVPVVVHAAFAPAPFESEYARPIHVDPMAVRYPDLQFVLAHVGPGLGWFEEAVAIAATKPNVHLEFSMWQEIGRCDEETFVTSLAWMRTRVTSRRLLYGSDRTGVAMRVPPSQWLERFRRLPGTARAHGLEITPAEVADIVGGNAARLFGLTASDQPSSTGDAR